MLLADVIIEKLTPIREDISRLLKEPGYLDDILKGGAERATELGTDCWAEVTEKVFGSDTLRHARRVTSTANVI